MNKSMARPRSLLRDWSFIQKASTSCERVDELVRQLARLAISSSSASPATYLTDNIHIGHILGGLQGALNTIACQLPYDADATYLVRELADEVLKLRSALDDGVCNTIPDNSHMRRLAIRVHFGTPLEIEEIREIVRALTTLVGQQ